MKTMLSKPVFRRFGKKALVIYLCWCLVKGLFFIFLGSKLFG